MSSDGPATQRAPIVVAPIKSVGLGILLTVLFGPLGLFYASIKGALIVLLVIPTLFAIASAVLAASGSNQWFLSGMLMIAILPLTMWITSIVWSVIAVNAYNRELLRSMGA